MENMTEEYFELKKHKITEENKQTISEKSTHRTFAPSSKHLHLHNITTENIKHSLCKSKAKPIVLSRNNENIFTRKEHQQQQFGPTPQQNSVPSSTQNNPLKITQQDGSIFLDELQEIEVKNIFKRYFPRGTKVAHARCGCGYLHPYISIPIHSTGNATLESEVEKTSINHHTNNNKIVIKRNISTENKRVTTSTSQFFNNYDHSERRSKPVSTLDQILGSNISQNPIIINVPQFNDVNFSDEEELEKLLNFTSLTSPNKFTPTLNETHNESLQEFPSKDSMFDNSVHTKLEQEKYYKTKYSELEEKIKQMESELKSKVEIISNIEEEKKHYENENRSYEFQLNELNNKIVELVYCVPPESSTLSHNKTNETSINTEDISTNEKSIQCPEIGSVNTIIGILTETSATHEDTKSIQYSSKEFIESRPSNVEIANEGNSQIEHLLEKISEKDAEIERLTVDNQNLVEERDFISQNVFYGIDANKKVLNLLEKELERIKNEMQVQSEAFSRERKILENEIESLQNQDTNNQELTTNKNIELEKELNDARTVIEIMTTEVNKANEASIKLSKDLQEIQLHKQHLEADLESVRKKYKALMETLQERIEEDDNNKQVIANTSQQVKIMNSELEALKKMLEEKQELVKDLEGKLTETQRSVEDQLIHKQDASVSTVEQFDEQKAQIDSLLEELKEKQEEVSSLREELHQSQKQSALFEEQLQEMKQFNTKKNEGVQFSREIEFMTDTINGESASKSDQVEIIERNTQPLNALEISEEKVQNITERVSLDKQHDFGEESSRFDDLLKEYSEDIKSKDTMLSVMENEIKEMTSLLLIKNSTIEESTSRLEKLEQQNLSLKGQLKSMEDQHEKLKEMKRELENQLNTAESELADKLEGALDESEKQKSHFEKSQAEIENLNLQIGKLKTDLEESLSTIEKLRKDTKSSDETDKLLEKIESLKQEIEKKEQIILDKEMEIKKTKEELNRFIEDYKNYKEKADTDIKHFQEQISSSFNDVQHKNEMIENLQQVLKKKEIEHSREMQIADQMLKTFQDNIVVNNQEIEKLNREKESLENSLIEKSQISNVDSKELNDLRREHHELKSQFDEYRQSNEKMQQEVERLLDQLTKGGASSSSSFENSPEMILSDRPKTPTHRNGKFSAIIQTSTPISNTTTIDLWKQLRSEILRLKQKNVELAQQIMQVNKAKEETISKYEKELRKLQLEVSKIRKVEVDFEKQKTHLIQIEEYGRKLEENNTLLNNHLQQLEYEKSNLLRLQDQTKSELQQLKDNLDYLTTENQRLLKAEKKRNLGDKVTPPTSLLSNNKKIK